MQKVEEEMGDHFEKLHNRLALQDPPDISPVNNDLPIDRDLPTKKTGPSNSLRMSSQQDPIPFLQRH